MSRGQGHGGSRGIGLATAAEFAAAGASVVIAGRDNGALSAAVARLGHHGTDVRAVAFLADAPSMTGAVLSVDAGTSLALP